MTLLAYCQTAQRLGCSRALAYCQTAQRLGCSRALAYRTHKQHHPEVTRHEFERAWATAKMVEQLGAAIGSWHYA